MGNKEAKKLGRRGGLATLKKYGKKHFIRIRKLQNEKNKKK